MKQESPSTLNQNPDDISHEIPATNHDTLAFIRTNADCKTNTSCQGVINLPGTCAITRVDTALVFMRV